MPSPVAWTVAKLKNGGDKETIIAEGHERMKLFNAKISLTVFRSMVNKQYGYGRAVPGVKEDAKKEQPVYASREEKMEAMMAARAIRLGSAAGTIG
jgi:hypothetical protein